MTDKQLSDLNDRLDKIERQLDSINWETWATLIMAGLILFR